MNIKLGFILSFIAGLSTLIGSVFIFFNNKKKDNIIISSLAFASGVMSFVSFFDLIPEAFNILNKSYNNIFSLINILLFIIIIKERKKVLIKSHTLKSTSTFRVLFLEKVCTTVALLKNSLCD